MKFIKKATIQNEVDTQSPKKVLDKVVKYKTSHKSF